MLDQLVIGNVASYDKYEASVKERSISAPKKKSIKETVPFSNKTYDFSAINGELYWEERELKYIFEIIADSPEELEVKRMAFMNWVMNVMAGNIYDPYEPGWHYIGTYDGAEYEDDESMEKTTITVTFLAYPYKISNNLTEYTIIIPAGQTVTAEITNNSSHRLTPTLVSNAGVSIDFAGVVYTVPVGEVTYDTLKLNAGESTMTITNTGDVDCTLVIKFYREVF